MRQTTINKKVGIFIEDLFCFSKFCRICVIIKTSGALKMNQPKISVIFWWNLSLRDPIYNSNTFFLFLPLSHMSQLSFDTKMSKKYGSWWEKLTREELKFFLQKSTDFSSIILFVSLLQRSLVDKWMISLAQMGPQAYKKLP